MIHRLAASVFPSMQWACILSKTATPRPARWVTSVAGTPQYSHSDTAAYPHGFNATGDPPQVAEWAGHSVNVLMQVCAKCISGRQEANKRRIFDATRPLKAPDPPDPTDSGA